MAFGVAIVRAATDELIERFATSLGVEFIYVRRKAGAPYQLLVMALVAMLVASSCAARGYCILVNIYIYIDL